MRQRNRFKQVKKLGISVPSNYSRVYSITTLPKSIQDELIKYPETVQDDSSYESDGEVALKYKDDPLKYIIGRDMIKRE